MLQCSLAVRVTELGHDAVSVRDVGLVGTADGDVFELAVAQDRLIVTENLAGFALLLDRRPNSDPAYVPVVFVRKSNVPPGRGLVTHLTTHLDRWALDHREAYIGVHWPWPPRRRRPSSQSVLSECLRRATLMVRGTRYLVHPLCEF